MIEKLMKQIQILLRKILICQWKRKDDYILVSGNITNNIKKNKKKLKQYIISKEKYLWEYNCGWLNKPLRYIGYWHLINGNPFEVSWQRRAQKL